MNDTAVSGRMLRHALNAILRRVALDRSHDVPYLAGYSRDARTIYIDRHLPASFITRSRRVRVDQYLILHEAIEKTLLDQLGLAYQHAHQIALRTEQAAVRGAGISWQDYDRFMQSHITEAGDETITKLPLDLDIKPYRDEHDSALLDRMQKAMKRERSRR